MFCTVCEFATRYFKRLTQMHANNLKWTQIFIDVYSLFVCIKFFVRNQITKKYKTNVVIPERLCRESSDFSVLNQNYIICSRTFAFYLQS